MPPPPPASPNPNPNPNQDPNSSRRQNLVAISQVTVLGDWDEEGQEKKGKRGEKRKRQRGGGGTYWRTPSFLPGRPWRTEMGATGMTREAGVTIRVSR